MRVMIRSLEKEIVVARFDLADLERSVIRPLMPTKSHGVVRVDDRYVPHGVFWQ